jgi:secreted Zn-dependent insulinase-like peptidase
LFQLQKSLADPKHPFHKFGSGNAQTLPATSASGVDIRDVRAKIVSL